MGVIIEKDNQNVEVDVKRNQLTFLDTRFYLSESGKYCPSVTTVLEAYPKGAQYYEWLKKVGMDADEIRDDAGRRGSVVHNLTERFDMGEEIRMMDEDGNIPYRLSEWRMLERYAEFREKHPFVVEHIELNMVSDALGLGGTLDRVMRLKDKRRLLLDIKTSNAIYSHYWLQLMAYDKMFMDLNKDEKPFDLHGILWLNAKTKTEGKDKGSIQGVGWQLLYKVPEEKDWLTFKATHRLWLAENGTERPRKDSYKLVVKGKQISS